VNLDGGFNRRLYVSSGTNEEADEIKHIEEKRRRIERMVRKKEMEELEPNGLIKTPWIVTKNKISK
jgi:hypothetical protein